MSTLGRQLFATVSAGLLLGGSPAWAAEVARLYPDVALRYTVGDPQARNPININEGPKTLAAADMKVSGFGSLIGNWAKKITDDFKTYLVYPKLGLAIFLKEDGKTVFSFTRIRAPEHLPHRGGHVASNAGVGRERSIEPRRI